jgi:type 1 fimbria pilin
VTLSLSPVTVSATPTGTSSYSWTAALMDGAGGTLMTTTESSASASTVDYNNGITNTNFKVRMSVGPSSGNVKPGTYTGTVTLDCLSL